MATREPGKSGSHICRGAAAVVEVGEDEIAEAIRVYFDDTHQVSEGAGAAPLAALMRDRADMAGRRVGVILTGGNIERARFLQVLSGELPAAAEVEERPTLKLKRPDICVKTATNSRLEAFHNWFTRDRFREPARRMGCYEYGLALAR